MGICGTIGRAVCRSGGELTAAFAIVGETLCAFLSLLVRPRQFRFGDAALAFQRAAFQGLPVMAGVGFLLGLILAFQSASALRLFGVESFVADMLAIALFRELGPLVTAILLAGRSGSAFAAEIGSMKMNEELDALQTMGLAPVRFLVLPRVAAAILAMPVLTVFVEWTGLAGGALVLQLMQIPPSVYWGGVASATTCQMILLGLGKSLLFGLLVGLIGCLSGLRTRETADGVGRAATAAVVGGIVAVAIADGVLAVLCYVWEI